MLHLASEMCIFPSLYFTFLFCIIRWRVALLCSRRPITVYEGMLGERKIVSPWILVIFYLKLLKLRELLVSWLSSFTVSLIPNGLFLKTNFVQYRVSHTLMTSWRHARYPSIPSSTEKRQSNPNCAPVRRLCQLMLRECCQYRCLSKPWCFHQWYYWIPSLKVTVRFLCFLYTLLDRNLASRLSRCQQSLLSLCP